MDRAQFRHRFGSGADQTSYRPLRLSGQAFERPTSELARSGIIPKMCIAGLANRALFIEAEKQRAWAEKAGVAVLTLASQKYPPYLKEIFAPPPVIFVRGDLSVFSVHAVGVVGTRGPTVYGKTVTISITRELVERQLAIVSGLAMGINTLAHQTCIGQNGRTIAVLGCGSTRCTRGQCAAGQKNIRTWRNSFGISRGYGARSL